MNKTEAPSIYGESFKNAIRHAYNLSFAGDV